MTAYPARTRPRTVSGVVDVLLGPAIIALALLFSLLVPVPAHAQLAGASQLDYNYQRTMSRIVAGFGAGLQMSSNSTLDILNGGRKIGSIALKEKRLMNLALLAGRAMTIPGMIGIGATVLLDYGLEKCADGTWCTKSTTEQAPNGRPYPATGGYWDIAGSYKTGSYADTCTAYASALTAGTPGFSYSYVSFRSIGTDTGYCQIQRKHLASGETALVEQQTVRHGGCASGHTLSDGMCYPPGYVPGNAPVPATAAQVNTAWQQAMAANPYLQQQTWGFEDLTQQNEDWAKAIAQLAEVI